MKRILIIGESGIKLRHKPIRIGIKEIPIPSSRSLAEKVYLNPLINFTSFPCFYLYELLIIRNIS